MYKNLLNVLIPTWGWQTACRLLVVKTSGRAAHDHILCSILLFTARFFLIFCIPKMSNVSPMPRSSMCVVNVFPLSMAGACSEPVPVPLPRRSHKGFCSIDLSCSWKPVQLLASTAPYGRELLHLTKCCVISHLLLVCCLWEVQGNVVGFWSVGFLSWLLTPVLEETVNGCS